LHAPGAAAALRGGGQGALRGSASSSPPPRPHLVALLQRHLQLRLEEAGLLQQLAALLLEALGGRGSLLSRRPLRRRGRSRRLALLRAQLLQLLLVLGAQAVRLLGRLLLRQGQRAGEQRGLAARRGLAPPQLAQLLLRRCQLAGERLGLRRWAGGAALDAVIATLAGCAPPCCWERRSWCGAGHALMPGRRPS
jgi:hypothetical protein